jgi:hypothetical protein
VGVAKDYHCEERLGNALVARIDNNQPLPPLNVLQERYLGHNPFPPPCTATRFSKL